MRWSTSSDLGKSWGLNRSVAATVSLLDREEAKEHLRIVDDDDDRYLDLLIPAVEGLVERELNRALLDQTWQLTFDWGFPAARVIQLPLPPLISVTSIDYIDEDGNAQTFSSTLYHVRTTGESPGLVALNENEVWPETDNVMAAATITFQAGYGTGTAAVPDGMRALMWLLLGHLFENREAIVSGTTTAEIPLGYQRMLWHYRSTSF